MKANKSFIFFTVLFFSLINHFYLTREIKLKSVQEKLVKIPGSLFIQVMNYSVLGLKNELALYLFISI